MPELEVGWASCDDRDRRKFQGWRGPTLAPVPSPPPPSTSFPKHVRVGFKRTPAAAPPLATPAAKGTLVTNRVDRDSDSCTRQRPLQTLVISSTVA